MPRSESSNRFYHWWEEPPNAKRFISPPALSKLLNNRLEAFSASNLRELFVDKLGLRQSDYVRYWRVTTGRQHSTRTRNLIRMCDALGLEYVQLESRRVLADRRWPLDLARPELTMLKSHILNEGTINTAIVRTLYPPTGKFSFSKRATAQFYNNDPALHRHVRWLARKCGAPTCRTARSRIGYTTILDGTTSRVLLRIGVPSGRRAHRKVTLDPNVISQERLWRYHFCSTLIEEGYCSLRLGASHRLVMDVGYYRGIDISRVFPAAAARRLRSSVRTVIGVLPRNIAHIVRGNPPLLMVQEIKHLRKLHSSVADPRVWPEPHPYEIRKCFGGTRIIASWRFVTSRRNLLEILSSYFNVSIPSSKRRHMQEIHKIYRTYGAKRFSLAEWSQLKRCI